MDYLVATSSPDQTWIRNFGYIFSINQNIHEINDGALIRC